MFDPTAFDNMKVVIEGALYDRDISGEINIIDRNDLINTAKMSRRFNISFKLPNSSIKARFEMESKLGNIAAELLPGFEQAGLSGCCVELFFVFKHEQELDDQWAKNILEDIWGSDRNIVVSKLTYPFDLDKYQSTVFKVKFDRLITENQLEDLLEMTEFMIITLEQLNEKNN